MVDDMQSFVAAAEVLKERGAYKIYVLATHGLLSSDAPRLIEESAIDEVYKFLLFECFHSIVPNIKFNLMLFFFLFFIFRWS